MGRSILYKIDVLKLIATRIEPTLALVLSSVLLSILIAVPMAAVAARNRGRAADHAVRLVSTLGIGFPPFWLALMLIILFSVRLGILPVSGYGETLGEKAAHLALPSLTVALSLSAVLTRSLRAAMVQALASDVATAARARGMPESIVFWRHVVPNSLVPTINLLAVNIGWLIGGTVVVESVFAIPGMGQLLVRAIFSRDYMVVQGVAHGVRLRHRAGELPRRHPDRRRRSAGEAVTAAPRPPPSPGSRSLGRWPTFAAGAGLLAAFVLLAARRAAGRAVRPDPAGPAGAAAAAPSLAHPFGTDNFGRDILSRVIWGARIDLQIAILGVVFPFLIGTLVGTVAGYFGGIVDTVFMRLVDIILAFPFLVLMLAIIAILGPGPDQLLHRHGAGRLGLLRPADPGADPGAEDHRLRRRRRQPRLQPAADHVPPPAAERASPARSSSPCPTPCSCC